MSGEYDDGFWRGAESRDDEVEKLKAELRRLRAECEALRASSDARIFAETYTRLDAQAAKFIAERDALRAELARLTTLRPASEHDRKTPAVWYQFGSFDGDVRYLYPHPNATHWTPLPDAKEATL